MFEPVGVALCSAVLVAAIAALCDWRTAEIPNWLTLPPLAISPLVYGHAFGLEHALRTVGATLLSGLVPYFLFRRRAMGGGDVKLLAALGAITSFDLLAGLEIQLGAFGVALGLALAILAWKGVLLRSLWAAGVSSINCVLPRRWKLESKEEPRTAIRMGGAILVATTLFALPRLALVWSSL